MAYQQIIAGKVKLNGLGGIRRHLQERERVKTNPDIDLSRSRLNFCIENLTPDKLQSRVNERIKQLHLKKRPRSDAVGLEDIIVSASVDFMLSLDAQTREQYFRDALHFFQDRYDKENIMYCQCHLDESNPHIHVGVVPVTSDRRLCAKELFSPKTLEQLQTDFHETVSKSYGLERGEHHSKKYLPLMQFKAQQAKQQAKKFADDLRLADISQQKIEQAIQSAHFAKKGRFFPTEDKNTIQLPADQFLYLKQLAEESSKMATVIYSLQDDIKKLSHDKAQTQADADFFRHQLLKLERVTEHYTAVPKFWRKHIDSEIKQLQRNFTDFCHDVNRAILQTFVATHGDADQTKLILHELFTKAGVKNFDEHISKVLRAAKSQLKRKSHPDKPQPSWKPPKPTNTDYSLPDQTGIVPLFHFSFPTLLKSTGALSLGSFSPNLIKTLFDKNKKEKTLALLLVALYNFSCPDLVTRSSDSLSARLVLAFLY